MIGSKACVGVSISSNTPSTGQDTVYCTTPANTAGYVDVSIETWGGSTTKAQAYQYILPAEVSFVSPSLLSTVPGTESGQAITIAGANFYGASKVTIGGVDCASFTVVSDTQIFCVAPNTITTAGDKAVAVTKGSIPGASSVNVNYTSTTYPTLQAVNAFSQCSTTAKLFRDTRDSQLYYVKLMDDGKCWMVDNVKYAGYGNLQTNGPLTANGNYDPSAQNFDIAKFGDPGATDYCMGSANMPANTNTRCGLMYNWYTATAGTGSYNTGTDGTQASGSICPANFRLPSGSSGVMGATTNGTAYTAADAPVLNASMQAGTTSIGSIYPYPDNWLPSGKYAGTYSGIWAWDPILQGTVGALWTSTTFSNSDTRFISYEPGALTPGGDAEIKADGRGVRCVMDPPVAENGKTIQDITRVNCPVTNKIWAVDARDNRTYWVQKMADGNCWMLTNLAYAGGGTNTYGDVRSITNNNTLSYTAAYYSISTNANPTTNPTPPRTSTNGGATNPQYGYHYNWCAAMGAQLGTAACSSTSSTPANTEISICPSGWRLPTGNGAGEYDVLNQMINNGATNTDAGLRTTWLGQYSGRWSGSAWINQGSVGSNWSSSLNNVTQGWNMDFSASLSSPVLANNKNLPMTVRCVAK